MVTVTFATDKSLPSGKVGDLPEGEVQRCKKAGAKGLRKARQKQNLCFFFYTFEKRLKRENTV
jgi:hypothetical protein